MEFQISSWLASGGLPAFAFFSLRISCAIARHSASAPHESPSHVAIRIPPLASGTAALDVAFVVSSARNWTNLWKPTIDAIAGPLLGVPNPDLPWSPNDDHIVRLGLHRTIDWYFSTRERQDVGGYLAEMLTER